MICCVLKVELIKIFPMVFEIAYAEWKNLKISLEVFSMLRQRMSKEALLS